MSDTDSVDSSFDKENPKKTNNLDYFKNKVTSF